MGKVTRSPLQANPGEKKPKPPFKGAPLFTSRIPHAPFFFQNPGAFFFEWGSSFFKAPGALSTSTSGGAGKMVPTKMGSNPPKILAFFSPRVILEGDFALYKNARKGFGVNLGVIRRGNGFPFKRKKRLNPPFFEKIGGCFGVGGGGRTPPPLNRGLGAGFGVAGSKKGGGRVQMRGLTPQKKRGKTIYFIPYTWRIFWGGGPGAGTPRGEREEGNPRGPHPPGLAGPF